MTKSGKPLLLRILLHASLFVMGLVLMTALYAGMILWELFHGPDLFAGRALDDHDAAARQHFWTSLVLVVINVLAAVFLWIKKVRSVSIGVALPLVIGGWMLIATLSPFAGSYQHEPFDSIIWKQSEPHSLPMARTLVEEEFLMGKTSDELQEMLGPGHHSEMVDNDNIWIWFINNKWHLRVVTVNDTAQYAYIWQPGMYY